MAYVSNINACIMHQARLCLMMLTIVVVFGLIESKDWMDQLEKEHDPLVSTGKEYMPKKMHPDNHRPRNPAAVRESFHLPASFSFSFGSCNLFFSIDANLRTNL